MRGILERGIKTETKGHRRFRAVEFSDLSIRWQQSGKIRG